MPVFTWPKDSRRGEAEEYRQRPPNSPSTHTSAWHPGSIDAQQLLHAYHQQGLSGSRACSSRAGASNSPGTYNTQGGYHANKSPFLDNAAQHARDRTSPVQVLHKNGSARPASPARGYRGTSNTHVSSPVEYGRPATAFSISRQQESVLARPASSGAVDQRLMSRYSGPQAFVGAYGQASGNSFLGTKGSGSKSGSRPQSSGYGTATLEAPTTPTRSVPINNPFQHTTSNSQWASPTKTNSDVPRQVPGLAVNTMHYSGLPPQSPVRSPSGKLMPRSCSARQDQQQASLLSSLMVNQVSNGSPGGRMITYTPQQPSKSRKHALNTRVSSALPRPAAAAAQARPSAVLGEQGSSSDHLLQRRFSTGSVAQQQAEGGDAQRHAAGPASGAVPQSPAGGSIRAGGSRLGEAWGTLTCVRPSSTNASNFALAFAAESQQDVNAAGSHQQIHYPVDPGRTHVHDEPVTPSAWSMSQPETQHCHTHDLIHNDAAHSSTCQVHTTQSMSVKQTPSKGFNAQATEQHGSAVSSQSGVVRSRQDDSSSQEYRAAKGADSSSQPEQQRIASEGHHNASRKTLNAWNDSTQANVPQIDLTTTHQPGNIAQPPHAVSAQQPPRHPAGWVQPHVAQTSTTVYSNGASSQQVCNKQQQPAVLQGQADVVAVDPPTSNPKTQGIALASVAQQQVHANTPSSAGGNRVASAGIISGGVQAAIESGKPAAGTNVTDHPHQRPNSSKQAENKETVASRQQQTAPQPPTESRPASDAAAAAAATVGAANSTSPVHMFGALASRKVPVHAPRLPMAVDEAALLSNHVNTEHSNALPGYAVGKVIGEGGFCQVRLAVHRLSGRKVAVKVIDKLKLADAAEARRIQREIRVMRHLSHECIIKLFEVVDAPTILYLVMEHAPSGSLLDYVRARKRLAEQDAAVIAQQIVAGLAYCHQREVVHRDIKLENILLDANNQMKLIDFGLSAFFIPGKQLRVHCGSPSYAAPEIVQRKHYDGPPVDVWSLGVVLFAMLAGHLPFHSSNGNKQELCARITEGKFTCPDYMSAPAKDLLSRMLCVDPSRRITLDQVAGHPWLTGSPRWESLGASVYMVRVDAGAGLVYADTQLVAELEAVGYTKASILQFLLSGEANYITAAYFLMAEGKAEVIRRMRGAAAVNRYIQRAAPGNALSLTDASSCPSKSSNSSSSTSSNVKQQIGVAGLRSSNLGASASLDKARPVAAVSSTIQSAGVAVAMA